MAGFEPNEKALMEAEGVTRVGQGKTQNDLMIGTAGVALLAAAMLAFAVYGKPPYSYFDMMKLSVVFADGLSAYALVRRHLANIPLAFLLVGSAGIEWFGKMHRKEWVPYNQANGLILLVASMACLAFWIRDQGTVVPGGQNKISS